MIDLDSMGKRAIGAKYLLQTLSSDKKNLALKMVADGLVADTAFILEANQLDLENGIAKGMHPGLLDRLRLDENRILAMREGLYQVSELEDPVGEIIETFNRPNGLHITKKRVPLGVIGIIYESRPNVTADAFALCFQTGNVVILKGGSDAIHSNKAITKSIRNSLEKANITADAVQLIEDTSRSVTAAFMKCNQYVDVLIPRGGAGLINMVVQNSSIPVIETGTGNCHIYIDQHADFKKAISIIINAKTQRIGVCNACESLVIHKDIAEQFLPILSDALKASHVEIHGDEKVQRLINCTAATELDYGTEYLDYKISAKMVDTIEQAIAHINCYNTKHSDAIITEDVAAAEQFLNQVDSACVYVNASTRFTDGYEFGFGAEIGISTQKLHARGPMGLKELTTYKYTIHGNGQIRQ